MNYLSGAVLLLRPMKAEGRVTNRFTAFFALLSRYPILQSIHTYYSLIGAVSLYRRCL